MIRGNPARFDPLQGRLHALRHQRIPAARLERGHNNAVDWRSRHEALCYGMYCPPLTSMICPVT